VFREDSNPTISPGVDAFRIVGDWLSGHGLQGYRRILRAAEIICQQSGNPQGVWAVGFL